MDQECCCNLVSMVANSTRICIVQSILLGQQDWWQHMLVSLLPLVAGTGDNVGLTKNWLHVELLPMSLHSGALAPVMASIVKQGRVSRFAFMHGNARAIIQNSCFSWNILATRRISVSLLDSFFS